MKQNTPAFGQVEPAAVIGNADKWDLYRNSFLKLMAEQARLQIITDVGPLEMTALENDDLEDAVVRVEHARLVYNHSRNSLALALLRRVEALGPQPGFPTEPGGRRRWIARVAELLSECRGQQGASSDDKRAAERIVSAANARFLEQCA